MRVCVCVFITAVPITKLFAGERGGEGYCLKGGGEEEGECERERAGRVRLDYTTALDIERHMLAEAAVDECRGVALPPTHRPHATTGTCASASGTIPLRLCKGPCLGGIWR